MKALILCALILTASHAVSAQAPLPRVFVTVKSADASGFTDPGSADRATLLKELTGQLKGKKKTLQLVPDAASADVTLEVTRAGIGVGTSSTSQVIGNTVATRALKEWQAVVTLRAGTYETEFSGSGLYTVVVAKQIANSIDAWIADNRVQLHR